MTSLYALEGVRCSACVAGLSAPAAWFWAQRWAGPDLAAQPLRERKAPLKRFLGSFITDAKVACVIWPRCYRHNEQHFVHPAQLQA